MILFTWCHFQTVLYHILDKVFKNGPSKVCGRQPLKNLNHFKFFKGCLRHILLGPFLNTLSHVVYEKLSKLQLWAGLMVNFRNMSNTNILSIYVKKIVTQNWRRTLTLIGFIENNKRSRITRVSMLFTIALELRQMNLFTRSYRNDRLSVIKRNSSFHGTSCCCHFHYMCKPWSSTCEFSET